MKSTQFLVAMPYVLYLKAQDHSTHDLDVFLQLSVVHSPLFYTMSVVHGELLMVMGLRAICLLLFLFVFVFYFFRLLVASVLITFICLQIILHFFMFSKATLWKSAFISFGLFGHILLRPIFFNIFYNLLVLTFC